MDRGLNTPISKKGLNDMGRKIVTRMNELGMMVDLSHVGIQTFYDVMEVTKKPVLVSHSCCYSICPVPRNLKDDQILAIGKNGGVIHLNFYSGFLDSSYESKKTKFRVNHKAEKDSLISLTWSNHNADEFLFKKYSEEVQSYRPSIDILLDHLDHIVKLIGVNHVGLGSDFDGIESPPFELNGVEDFPKITEALLKRGYSKKEVKKIMGGNFLRLYKEVANP
jgi:membrane dipeptidase